MSTFHKMHQAWVEETGLDVGAVNQTFFTFMKGEKDGENAALVEPSTVLVDEASALPSEASSNPLRQMP